MIRARSALVLALLSGMAVLPAAHGATPRLTEWCNGWFQSSVTLKVTTPGYESLISALANSSMHRPLFERLWQPERHSVLTFRLPVSNFITLRFPEAQDSEQIAYELGMDPVLRALGVTLAYAQTDAPPPPGYPLPIPAVVAEEYYNTASGHYRLAISREDKARLDEGHEGPYWKRSGKQMIVGAPYSTYLGSVVREFRFDSGIHPGGRFFTASRQDCGTLRNNDWGLTYLGAPFTAPLPVDGDCGAGRRAVHRSYNNRWMFNDSNHRFTEDFEAHREMLAQGWVDEGIAFCSFDPANPLLWFSY